MKERNFGQTENRKFTAEQSGHQRKDREDKPREAGAAEDQANRDREAINAVHHDLESMTDLPILAVLVPVAERPAPSLPEEQRSAGDVAAEVAEKVVRGVVKTAKVVVKIAKAVFDKREAKAS